MACAPSKDSDKPGHPPRVFAVYMNKALALNYPLSAQWRLWSDWAVAQADLSLRWAHRPFCRFCHALAQMSVFFGCRKNCLIWSHGFWSDSLFYITRPLITMPIFSIWILSCAIQRSVLGYVSTGRPHIRPFLLSILSGASLSEYLLFATAPFKKKKKKKKKKDSAEVSST